MQERKSRKRFNLTDLEVFEVSLVTKPANGRPFYLTKSETDEGTKMSDDKILAVLETPAENEQKLIVTGKLRKLRGP